MAQEKNKCTICSTSRNAIAEITKKNENFKWAYLGEDVSKAIAIENALGKSGEKIDTGGMLQEIARSLKWKYVEYIGKMSLKKKSLIWWGSALSEKSPYSSKTFLHSCYLMVYLEIVKKYSDMPLVFFVEAGSLRKAMKENAPSGIDVECKESSVGHIKESVGNMLNCILRRGYFLTNNIYKTILAKWIYQMQNKVEKNVPYEVLHTFAAKRSFDAQNKKFKENFYGDLPEYAKRTSKKYIIYPSIWGASYKTAMDVLKLQERILIHHAFLSIFDIFNVFFSTMKRPKSDCPKFEGMDIAAIIDEDVRKDYGGIRMPSDILVYHAIKNMKKNRILISNLIEPYENHTNEKVARIAVREFYPDARITGYQHSTFSSMHLEYLFSKEEFAVLPFPDEIITSGDQDKRTFTEWGYPIDRLVRGGAIRYADVLQLETNNRALNPDKPTVLVTTSINKPDALELVWKTIKAFENGEKYRIIIKCHPYMPFKKIIKELGIPVPGHFEISDTPIPKLLDETDVLVYTSSTTCLEAIAKGVPIIYVGSDLMIELNPLDFDPDVAFCAKKPEDIVKGVEYWVGMKKEELDKRRKDWKGTVQKMFCKVDDKTYSLFFRQ
ncbi:MAG: hypothetical protein ABII22_05945 [Candidatus Micrarchaeota archaeon]